jgi:hypothetical protein
MWSGLQRVDVQVEDINLFDQTVYTSYSQSKLNDWPEKIVYPINDQDYVEKNWVFCCNNMHDEYLQSIKFADTNKEQKIYSGAKENFKQYFEKNSSIEGDEKNNYTIPSITGLGGGILAYFVAERFGKNKIMYSLGGLLLGVTVGLFILKSKK